MKLSEHDYQELETRFPEAYAFMMKRQGIKEVKDLNIEYYDGHARPERLTWIMSRLKDINHCAPWLYNEAMQELAQNK